MTFKINNININNVNDLKQVIKKNKNILEQTFIFKEFKGNLYLYISIYGTPEMLKYIENFLKDIKNYKDLEYGNDAYLATTCRGNLTVMKYLEKEHNWSPHVKNNDGQDAYLCASYNGQLEIMKYLEKKHNLSPFIKDNNGNNAYLLASFNGRLEIMKYLEKKHNLSPFIKDNYGNDAYLLASCNGYLEIMKYLEKTHKSSPFIKNNNGNDVYLLALFNKQLEIMKYLDNIHNWKKHNYQINIEDKEILEYFEYIKFKTQLKLVKDNINETCIICLENFNKNDIISKCENGHNIHMKCYFAMPNKIKCCLCNKDNMITQYSFLYK